MASVTNWSVALLALSFFDYPLLTVCGNLKRNCREVEKYYNQTNNNIQDPKFDFITKMFLRAIVEDQREDLDSRCAGQDQCSLGTHDCNPNAYCHETHLAYNCECKPGYDGDGVICGTIDECATNTHNCHRDAICKDTTPLFTCTCKLGYQGDGKNCTSINECSLNTHNCSKNAICTDLTPYFTCHCKPGYRGNGFKCTGK
ncbi:unnamed protein product [Porites lobata]|uniref:EGF-like domain-containing protein n=1 Tax=Porites lobata TaxID=104759 RepID=A0ABN8MZL4_9CNID|nr:unnamed protein product [Porites lobata]